jgi:hypothetical protein
MIGPWTGVTAKKLSTVLTKFTKLIVLILLLLFLPTLTLAMGTGPFSFWSFLHFRIQAYQVICSWASVTKDDLPTLLTNLAVVLMVLLLQKKWEWKTLTLAAPSGYTVVTHFFKPKVSEENFNVGYWDFL